MARLQAAGINLDLAPVPEHFSSLNDVHATLMAYEVARNHIYEYDPQRREQLGPKTLEVMNQGWAVSYDDYLDCRQQRRQAQVAFDEIARSFDAILVPSAVGEAPVLADGTGDPVFNRLWSLLGTPALTLPISNGSSGLPIGVQLVAARDSDWRLLSAARSLEQIISG